jgi:hypothetical protein
MELVVLLSIAFVSTVPCLDLATRCTARAASRSRCFLSRLSLPTAPDRTPYTTQTQGLVATYLVRALLAFFGRLDRELVAPFQPLLEDPDSLKPVRGGSDRGR